MHRASRGAQGKIVFLEARHDELQRGIRQRRCAPRVQQHALLHRRHDGSRAPQPKRLRAQARRHRRGNHSVHHRRGRRHAEQHAHGEHVPRVAQRQEKIREDAVIEPLRVLHHDHHRSRSRLPGNRPRGDGDGGRGGGDGGARNAARDRTRAGERSSRAKPPRGSLTLAGTRRRGGERSRRRNFARRRDAVSVSVSVSVSVPVASVFLRLLRLRFRGIDRFVFFRDFAVPSLEMSDASSGDARRVGARAGARSELREDVPRGDAESAAAAATTAAGCARDDCGSTFVRTGCGCGCGCGAPGASGA